MYTGLGLLQSSSWKLDVMEPRHLEDHELQFMAQYLAEDDINAVRKHLIDVWRALVSGPAPVYFCIRELMFLEPRLKRHPFYSQALRHMWETRAAAAAAGGPPALWLDVGCALGTDVRQLRLDGLAREEVVALDVVPDYWQYGLQMFRDAEKPPCTAIFGDLTSDDFLPTGSAPPAPAALPCAAMEPASAPVCTVRAASPSEAGVRGESAGGQRLGGDIFQLVGAVHVASATAVLHCLSREGVERLLHKIALLLRPGGVLMGATLGAPSPREWQVAYQEGSRRWLHSVESLGEVLQRAGFEAVEVQPSSWQAVMACERHGTMAPGMSERMQSHVGCQADSADRQLLTFMARKPAGGKR